MHPDIYQAALEFMFQETWTELPEQPASFEENKKRKKAILQRGRAAARENFNVPSSTPFDFVVGGEMTGSPMKDDVASQSSD